MTMRTLFFFILLLLTIATSLHGAEKTIAVLDFALIDEQAEYTGGQSSADDRRRLENTTVLMRAELAKLARYTVVDSAKTREQIANRLDTQTLHECNGCELDLGRALGADWVLVGWIQKVSNLILNINVLVSDVATGEPVAHAFVDLRGNTDRSWERATHYLLDNILLERLALK